jgi:hypothetical protein
MKDSIKYYNSKLNELSSGRLFNIIKFPEVNSIILTALVLLVGLLSSILTGSVILVAFVMLSYLAEYYSVRATRTRIIDVCLVDEIMLDNDFKTNGTNSEFSEDPNYVTDADREYIFSDALYQVSPTKTKDALKSHRVLILNTMASFIIGYLILSNYIA